MSTYYRPTRKFSLKEAVSLVYCEDSGLTMKINQEGMWFIDEDQNHLHIKIDTAGNIVELHRYGKNDVSDILINLLDDDWTTEYEDDFDKYESPNEWITNKINVLKKQLLKAEREE